MTRNTARIIGTTMLVVAVLAVCTLPLAAEDLKPIVNTAVASGVTPRLDELAKLPQPAQYGFHEANPVRRIPKQNFGTSVDPVEQRGSAPSTNFSIIANILGVGNGFPGYSVTAVPPDTNMAVGGTQILQWVNFSYTICSKTSPYPCGPAILGNTLWAVGIPGTLCANQNDGDIIAQYDQKASRWFLTQNVFVSPYAVCVAISDTDDANGTYHVWQFPVPGNGFPDYPKWGVWPTSGVNNGYYQAVNNFGTGNFMGPQICAYDRAAMLSGAPSPTQICFQLSIGPECLSQGIGCQDSVLPGDLDSIIGVPNTPAGTPQCEFYIGSVADVDNSHLSLYEFCADFSSPPNSFFLGDNNSILQQVPTYNGSCSGQFGGACVPSLGGAPMDTLGDRLMYRFAYYNDGPPPSVAPCATCAPLRFQHWRVNLSVESSGGETGVRYFEFTAPPVPGIGTLTSTSLTTTSLGTGTWAPDNTYRWMGSVAQDKTGNLLVGYSQSSASTHPRINLAGRIPSDPPGLEPELLVVQGNGSQPDSGDRWGDYSAMRIDPVDHCTFWYTQEFYMVTQSFDWSTQIASAKFSNCH